MHEIFNRNSVKVSRSCTGNISQIISSQNGNIFQPNKNQEPPCNCRQKENCAMQGKCRRKNVLYKCTASTPTKPERVYIGISEDEWKKRYQNHTKSFPNKRYKNKTSLSSYVWKIKKETGQIPTLTMSIVKTVPAYSNTTKKCRLYLHAKLEILMYLDPEELLNKRSEIRSRYPHQRKYLFRNYDSKD